MPTCCMDCGRELAPTVIPGAWRCGRCIEILRGAKKMSDTPAAKGGAAPPPPPEPEPEREPEREPEARTVEAPPPLPLTVHAVARREPAGREEPSWRELGHWLGLAEADDGTPACRQAGAALRLYLLAQMDLPLWAAPGLTMIKGKLHISAELLRYLAQRSGYRLQRVDDSAETCTAVLIRSRTGEEIGRTTFTIEDARRAGLVRAGSNWITYPGRMLWARASAYVIRDFAPEVALGMQTADEAEEAYAREPEPIGVDYDYAATERDEDIPF